MGWYKIALEWGGENRETLSPEVENDFSPEKEILDEISGPSEDDLRVIVLDNYDLIVEQAQGYFDMHMSVEDTTDRIAKDLASTVGLSTTPSLEWTTFWAEIFEAIQATFPEETKGKGWEVKEV